MPSICSDYIVYQKGELLDAVYLQQNSFDPVDFAVVPDRQRESFDILYDILMSDYDIASKSDARVFFNQLRQAFLDWNGIALDDERFAQYREALVNTYRQKVRA